MAKKIVFKNLAHSEDESTAGSVGGKRATAIFDAWSVSSGASVSDIAESAAEQTDVEVTDTHVSAYVKGVKTTDPSLFAAMPALRKEAITGRGRQPMKATAGASLLALIAARKAKAESDADSESDS